MKVYPLCFAVVFSIATLPVARLAGQVTTNVPSPVQGAEPVTVEHIKIHGEALEGNLEGDAIDRDVIVFLPPSYKTKKRHLRFRKASVHRCPRKSVPRRFSLEVLLSQPPGCLRVLDCQVQLYINGGMTSQETPQGGTPGHYACVRGTQLSTLPANSAL